MGPCAKRQVKCIVRALNGCSVTGENWCANPQDVCPREEGEGYEKCQTICCQLGHAEEVAAHMMLMADIVDWHDSYAFLKGHDHYCDTCRKTLEEMGVTHFLVISE